MTSDLCVKMKGIVQPNGYVIGSCCRERLMALYCLFVFLFFFVVATGFFLVNKVIHIANSIYSTADCAIHE